jgi:hypothetical protein
VPQTRPHWPRVMTTDRHLGSVRIQTDGDRRWFDVYSVKDDRPDRPYRVVYAAHGIGVTGHVRTQAKESGAPVARAAYRVGGIK